MRFGAERHHVFVDPSQRHVGHACRAEFLHRGHDDDFAGSHGLASGVVSDSRRCQNQGHVRFFDDAPEFGIAAHSQHDHTVGPRRGSERLLDPGAEHQGGSHNEYDESDASRGGGSRSLSNGQTANIVGDGHHDLGPLKRRDARRRSHVFSTLEWPGCPMPRRRVGPTRPVPVRCSPSPVGSTETWTPCSLR